MGRFVSATSLRTLRRCAFAATWLLLLALAGCNEVDPLEAIRQQQTSGDFKGSIEPLQALLETRPDDPEANFLYGRALALSEGPNLAVWSLRKAMEDPEWLVAAGTQLAAVDLAAEDFNEVVEVTGRILEREPENARVLLLRAAAQAGWKKNPELALADAKRALEINPDMLEAYEPMIIALIDLGRTKEAGDALAEAGRRLVEVGTSEGVFAWHCTTTAVFEQETGELEKARKTWSTCLEKYPTNLDTVSSAISFYDDQGEPQRALDILRTGLERDPASRAIRVALADRLRLLGDTAEAEAVLREATRSENPELAAAGWMDLSKLREAMGEYGAAADALERAIELAKEAGSPNAQLLFEYADALVLAGRLDRALEASDDLQVPAYRHMIRARVAQERRDPARALEEFDAALELWPDNPFARYYAALAAEELGDFDRAIAEFRYSMRISPVATDAQTRGAALLFAEHDLMEARGMLLTGGDGNPPREFEAQRLFMRLSGQLGDSVAIRDALVRSDQSSPAWTGLLLAAAAEGLSERSGPAVALSMLATAPGVDYQDPRYAAALRTMVRFAHQAGKADSVRAVFKKTLAAHPESGAFQEIHGLDLELSGAPGEAVLAAYTRALELGPGNAWALADLGRLVLRDDPEAALGYFDRAAAANPTDPDPKLQAARVLIASEKITEAEQRLHALLLEHPYEVNAAMELARLDLDRGVATPRTLERARRAARFGGGADALELLSQVHAQLGETELAEQFAARARSLREAQAAKK